MSDIIREPYELSVWETSVETKDVINFMPPLSTMYGDEWDRFNEKNTDGKYGGFLDWAKDKSKIADYSKDWTEFSYTNAQDIGDDVYTFETTLELPAGKYVFCIQFKDLVEENLPSKGSATFNINENGFEPLKNYIDSPYKLDFEIEETSKTMTIQFKVPWSGVQKKLLFLKYTTTSFVSFSTRLGLFSVTDRITAENYEIPDPFPLYDGTDGSWIKKENKLCVIGSNDMTSENRIVNPTIKTNVNGEKTLTFTLYSRYFDADVGEFVNNNFVDLLHSESYLKLRRGFGNNAKWEEYIVKNIAENSENKTYTYTAKRAAAIELGKTGYGLEFSEELMNNQGTAIELTKQVFAGSDWTVEEAESDKFWGAMVEPVYKATLRNFSNENIKCIRQAKLGSYELYYNEVQVGVGFPETGDDVYIPYSSYQNWTESGEIQLLWTEASGIEIDEDGVIYNANSYVLETTNTELLNNVEISGQIKGDNLQKRIKTHYIKGINKIVEEGTIGEKPIYKITDIEYQTDASVPELIVNGSDFQSTAGWRAHGSAAVIDLSTDIDSINIIKEEGYVTSLQLKNESTIEGDYAYFYNAAIRSNVTVIDNFTKGEEYYLVVKGSGTVNAFVSLYEYDDDGNVIFEKEGNSGIILNFSLIDVSDEESIFSAVCSDSISKKEIIENNIGLFFKVGAGSTLEIESVSLFKKVANENNGYYRPGEAVEAKTIIKEIYYDPSLVNNTKATSMEEIVPTSGEGFVPTYYEEYSKISSIKISKSNRFNILQEICEAFECWADLIVEHDERGNITNKKVRLKNFIGENKNVGFSYKINLKGINRTIVSDQIVTKLIVEPNNNENGLNGFTTIARAKNNKSKDIALYNFDYYIRQKALESELVKKDIYDTKGLLYRLGKANSKIADLNGELIALQMQRTQIQSNLTTQKELYQAARDEIDQLRQDFYDRTGKFFDPTDDFRAYDNDPTIKSIVVAIIAQNKVFNAAIGKMVYYEFSYEENKKQIAGLESEIDIYKKDQQSYLNIFNDKYANYIQEGTWTDESYYDDDLYYFDAQNVLYTSAFPKVSYTINVIDVSPLGGQYTPFKFSVGDKTYIEDTEFFGWNISGTSPYKEEVVISEITENLDSPEQNKITVQNYKTQFEDLFQRIAATTQSLQYAAGGYQRAANKITSTNSVDTETIQNSFLNGIINLQNMGNMSVSWTPEGLVISNQKDSNNRLRLSNVGIAQSEDGGDTWKMLVLAGRGIVANSIVTGTLDANKISIKSGDAATFIWDAKGLRAYDTTWGEDGNVLNVNYNNYIEFNDRGLVSHHGKNKSFELTAEGNLTLSGSLKVAVLEYGKVQAIGGIVLIRPSSLIKKAEYYESIDGGGIIQKQTKIWVETPNQFSIGDWCVIGSNLEDIGKDNNATPYEILSIDETDKYLTLGGNLIETFGDLTNLALVSIIEDTETPQENNIGIAINSSTNEAFSNARSLSIFESKVLNDTWVRYTRLLLGELPEDIVEDYKDSLEFPEGKSTTYGLYADNAIITGHINAKSGKIGHLILSNNKMLGLADERNSFVSGMNTIFRSNLLYNDTIFLWAGARGGHYDYSKGEDPDNFETINEDWTIMGKDTTKVYYNQKDKLYYFYEYEQWKTSVNGIIGIPYKTIQQIFTQNNWTEAREIIEKTAKFYVTHEGILHATNADIEGTITAKNGRIGGENGWIIKTGAIYSGTTSMTSTTVGTYIGTDGIRNYSSNNAYVNIQNGILTAKNVDLSGLIKTSIIVDLNNTQFLQYSDVADWWNATKSPDQKEYDDLGWLTSPPKWWVDSQYKSGYEEEMEALLSQNRIGLFQKIQIKDTTEFQEANLTPNQGLYLSNKEYYLNLNTSVFSIKSSKDGEGDNTDDTSLERFRIDFPTSSVNVTSLEINGLIFNTRTLIGSIETAAINTKGVELSIVGKDTDGDFVLYHNTDDDKIEMIVDVNKTKGVLYGLNELEGIPSGADLNAYTEPGVYAVQSNSTAGNISNIPTKVSGRLIVYSAAGTPTTNSYSYLIQEYHPFEPKRASFKRFATTGGTTNQWTFEDWLRQDGVKVLWSGLSQISNTDTLDLAEAISKQPHGIVLRFVAYNKDSGVSYKYHYNEYFVSKDFVNSHNGEGHTFSIWGNYFNVAATKYVYIYDTYVTGNVNNVNSGTAASGIVYDNSQYVLCEIIGV